MVKLRKQLPELVYGKYELLDQKNEKVYAYTRTLQNKKVLVMLNFSTTNADFNFPEEAGQPGQVLINNLKGLSLNRGNTGTAFKITAVPSRYCTIK